MRVCLGVHAFLFTERVGSGEESENTAAVDGIASLHALQVGWLARTLRVISAFAGVHGAERFASAVALRGVVDFAEQTAAHRLEGFVKRQSTSVAAYNLLRLFKKKGSLIRVAETGPSN